MYLIGSGILLTMWSRMPIMHEGCAAIDERGIIDMGGTDELRKAYPGADFIDAHGAVIMPGLIDAHTHSARALSRFDPGQFDEAQSGRLTLEGVIDSAYASYILSIKNGVTTVIDMLSHMSDPRGVLLAAAGAVADLGIRAALGCGANGLRGGDALDGYITENREFIRECARLSSPAVRPMVCIDPFYSLDREGLLKCLSMSTGCAGFNIALSEGLDDTYYAKREYGDTPTGALLSHSLPGEAALLAHCAYMSKGEAELAAKAGAAAVCTPLAELLSGGATSIPAIISSGVCAGLGSDGLTGNMLSLPFAAAARLASAGFTGEEHKKAAVNMLTHGNARIASRIFHRELGVIKPGAEADITVTDYVPCTDMTADNAYLHILYGMKDARCIHTFVRGKPVMLNGQIQNANLGYTFERTRKTARKLFD